MLLHTKIAVLDYYFSTQRKFFHQMNSALALGCLRLSELSSIPSHVMGMLLVIAAAHAYCSIYFLSFKFEHLLGRTENHSAVAAAKSGKWQSLLVSRISYLCMHQMYVMY
eukprot:scaffold2282_cov77-Skeletonema_dohrnii-CCMP3373.AAC.7